MYLKSLEIHGFKSFPNRTVLTFEPGTTVIVGPNGSGKSNISDAMRWVLGEVSSKNIRGNTMDSVIFGGTDIRRPMGFAEVSVCFDNTDPNFRFDVPYDEVTVTRRYFKGGPSEFMINRKVCRRKDVHELFMNTGIGRDGYSIIGQGKVAEMISRRSEDRRNVFEEAAGISGYRHRKHETELKLEATAKNMETTSMQIAMYEEQLGPLEKEAERARRGESIKEEKRAVDVALWLYDTGKIYEDVKSAETTYRTQKEEMDTLNATVEKLYAERGELDEIRTKSLYRSEGILQNINQVKEQIHQLTSRSDVIATEIGHANLQIAQCEARRAELEKNLASAKEELSSFKAKQDANLTEKDNIMGEKLELLCEQNAEMQHIKELEAELAESLKKIEALDIEIADLRVRLDVLKSARQGDQDKHTSILEEIKGYEENGERLRQEATLCEKNAAGFKAKVAEQDEAIESCNRATEALLARKEKTAEKIGTLKVSRSTKENRAADLQRMMDQMEGFGRSVKVVMSEYEEGRIRGTVYGPLSSLVTIHREYVTAVEMALGSSAQHIVTDTDMTAKAAIEALKRADKGRATFLPVNTIRPGGETDEVRDAADLEGYVARADELVDCDDTFRGIVQWLLMRTVVFDTLDNAVLGAKELKHKVRIVTLDGQIINAGGSMTGGSLKNEGTGILARNGEIVELREEARQIGEKIKELEEELKEIDEEIRSNKEAVADAEQNKELLYSMARTQFSALDSANARLSANESLLEKLREDLEALDGRQGFHQEEIDAKEKSLGDQQKALNELKTYREEVNQRLGEHLAIRDSLTQKLQQLEIRIAEIGRDVEASQAMAEGSQGRLDALEADLARQNEETARLKQSITDLDSENGNRLTAKTSLEKELEMLSESRTGLQADMLGYDKRLTELNEYIKIRENEKNNVTRVFYNSEVRYQQLCEQQEKLSVRLQEEYGMSYEDAVAAEYPAVTPENENEMRQTAVSCYNRLRNIGGYSPTAIQDYLDVKEKYDQVNGQYTDLRDAYQDLTEIIRKLEAEMAQTFVTAFEEINANFGVVFRELFGGGMAELTLTDPDNVLTCGIEINVAPPGKKIDSLSLLSGGEQAFVAIALFFSILKLHPTPFCILDEVEAALDEVNVFRFGEYLKRFCSDTQFILITHRRGTMQIADRLYGVTMPQKGVSKVICVDIAEMETKKMELTDKD